MPTAEHEQQMTVARQNPTAHVPRHVTNRQVLESMQGGSSMGRFNSRLAVAITKGVGTMWCAYVFAVIGLLGLTGALTGNTFLQGVMGSISSYFLQLVLLPIIIVGQNVISTAQDKRAEADHETLTALHTINVQQLTILKQQEKILEKLETGNG